MIDLAKANSDWISLGLAAPRFKAWFLGSKAVANGKPVIAYRADSLNSQIDLLPLPGVPNVAAKIGFWFTSLESDARLRSDAVTGLYLSIKTPRRMSRRQLETLAAAVGPGGLEPALRRGGFDGLILSPIPKNAEDFEPGSPEMYMVFSMSQAKSPKNSGLFDSRSNSLFDYSVDDENMASEDEAEQGEDSTDTKSASGDFTPEVLRYDVVLGEDWHPG